jgi:hypothetical protein
MGTLVFAQLEKSSFPTRSFLYNHALGNDGYSTTNWGAEKYI